MAFKVLPAILPLPLYRAVVVIALAALCGLAVTTVLWPPADVVAGTAEQLAALNTGDTAWMMTSSAMVLLMTPGLAFFYGGAMSHTDVVNTIMMTFCTMALVAVLWVIVGFSLAFGTTVWGGVIGSPSTYALFTGVGAAPNPDLAATIPLTVFASFQATFAIITPSIIVGAFSEHIRFQSLLLFYTFWLLVVYCPTAHMIWYPTGLLRTWGVLDFAGGTVVHMSSGFSALAGSLYLYRKNEGKGKPASLTLVVLGTGLLWFGWFGFNAGSAGAASYLAGQAWLTTNTSAAACMLTWMLLDLFAHQEVQVLGACSGAIVGLVVITPAAGFVTVGAALCMGIIGAIVCWAASKGYGKYSKVKDTLDVFPCHGVGGAVGMILTSCFANPAVNSAASDGLFYGGVTHFWHTLVALAGLVVYFVIGTWLCLLLTDVLSPLRLSPAEKNALGRGPKGEIVRQLSLRHRGDLDDEGAGGGSIAHDLSVFDGSVYSMAISQQQEEDKEKQ